MHQTNRTASTLRWLILTALAWSQLASALHPLHHDATDANEPCAVCLNLERDHGAPVGDPATCFRSPIAGAVQTDRHALVTAVHSPLYRSRASP